VQEETRFGGDLRLRQQLASATNENKQLAARITTAATRLENLLSHIPEEDA